MAARSGARVPDGGERVSLLRRLGPPLIVRLLHQPGDRTCVAVPCAGAQPVLRVRGEVAVVDACARAYSRTVVHRARAGRFVHQHEDRGEHQQKDRQQLQH
eukprot:7376192-Prymnesium_polylepis.1